MGRIKNLVFDHILDRPLEIIEAMFPNSPAIIPELQHQVARLITSITNRLPAEPITKVTISANPISVMSDFRHILETYETNIRLSAAQEDDAQEGDAQRRVPLLPEEGVPVVPARPVQSRLFSLFPSP
ncbi:hypothetical protein BC941DRAFT_445213, partial [Chlamydoabsidia padenii]